MVTKTDSSELSQVDRLIRLLKKEKHDVFYLLYDGDRVKKSNITHTIEDFGLISEAHMFNSSSNIHYQHIAGRPNLRMM